MKSDYLPPAARGCGLEAVLHQLAQQVQCLQRMQHETRVAPPMRHVFADAPVPE